MPAGYSPPPSFHALQRSASPLGATRSCGVGNQTDFCELSSACDCQRLGVIQFGPFLRFIPSCLFFRFETSPVFPVFLFPHHSCF
ncbi:hypothetical protein TNCT_210791 [Trichonephila clavata]|uniref:Uncharacterized protein n=1 Tax=Trichonephila clavata TaxID=2740835 RepID=A0A8X6K342_TRICU|nr:hypothetical protein TNCT_210791 [Trichonephila clavata]